MSPCIENVNTDASPLKIAAVPLPWCTSRSTIAIRRAMLIALQHPGADGDVVEHAEAFAAIGERVVRAAGQVRRHAVIERGAGRRDRRADRSARALDHLRRPRESDAPLDVGRHRSVHDGVDILRIVHEPQIVERGRRRFVQIIGRDDAFGEDALAQPRVLRHRELVSLRQRQHEVIGVKRAQADSDYVNLWA